MLIAGSASGELVGALRERGLDAWGIENNRYIHGRTPKALQKYNRLGSVVDMPFKDGAVRLRVRDLPVSRQRAAGRQGGRGTESRRQDRPRVRLDHPDMAPAVIEQYDLLRGVKKLGTWWEWSELFFGNGFDLSMHRRMRRRGVGGDARGRQRAGALVR